ncbi:MAG: DUF389 domain-containing protein [Bryobacteraceae bacterium]
MVTNPGPDSRSHLLRWLRIDPDTRLAVCSQVFEAADFTRLSYWLEIFFAAGIATFGLVLNSPAVIIGAMLISPLMGPIMATGLALAVGDVYLGIRAILNLGSSIAVSIGFSAALVWLLPFHSATAEIIARTNPNLLDLGIALLSGLAGSVAVSRSGGAGGGATALPGVAIAVALMPPLCTIGFGLGSGLNLSIMAGAGLLFLTNLVAIVASAFVVFLLLGMNPSTLAVGADSPRAHDRLARILLHSPLARLLTAGAQLRWRIVMILLLLASVAVPLRTALLQVASETIARGVVQNELHRLVSSDATVSQQVRIDPDRITIRVISTQPISSAQAGQVRQALERRLGRIVDLSVDAVASKSELAALVERIRTPTPVVTPEFTLEELRQRLAVRIRPAIEEFWPSKEAPILDVGIALETEGPSLRVRYQAAVDLGPVPEELILKGLRSRLDSPTLTLAFERVSVPSKARKRSQR